MSPENSSLHPCLLSGASWKKSKRELHLHGETILALEHSPLVGPSSRAAGGREAEARVQMPPSLRLRLACSIPGMGPSVVAEGVPSLHPALLPQLPADLNPAMTQNGPRPLCLGGTTGRGGKGQDIHERLAFTSSLITSTSWVQGQQGAPEAPPAR